MFLVDSRTAIQDWCGPGLRQAQTALSVKEDRVPRSRIRNFETRIEASNPKSDTQQVPALQPASGLTAAGLTAEDGCYSRQSDRYGKRLMR